MRRLTCRVSLEPVPKNWADELATELLSGVSKVSAELGAEGIVVSARRPPAQIKLVTGSHLKPGATYTVRGVRDGWPRASVHIGSWSPQVSMVLSGVVLGRRRGAAVLRGEFARQPSPGLLTFSMALRPRPGKVSLLQMSVSAEVALAELYEAGGGAGAVAAGRLESPAGTVWVELNKVPSQADRWDLEVSATFSHWYTLPLMKSALMIERRLAKRRRVTDRVATALGAEELRDQAANEYDYMQLLAERAAEIGESAWNAEVPGLVKRDPAMVVREIVARLTTP